MLLHLVPLHLLRILLSSQMIFSLNIPEECINRHPLRKINAFLDNDIIFSFSQAIAPSHESLVKEVSKCSVKISKSRIIYVKEAPSSHLEERSNTIQAELIEAPSSDGQAQGVKDAETASNNQEGDNGLSESHYALYKVQSFLGDCTLEDLEYEEDEAINAAPAKVASEVQSSPVRRRLSCQYRVAIDDTIERLLKLEEEDTWDLSASVGKGEGNIDNGNITSKAGFVNEQLYSQVSMAIDDTIEQILGFAVDETEASATNAKGERNVDYGSITAMTATAHRRPSSQVSMAIDDCIKRILFLEDEEEDIKPSGIEVIEGRGVHRENVLAKIVPVVPADDNIFTHDKSQMWTRESSLQAVALSIPMEENKSSENEKFDYDAGLGAPIVSSAQLNSSALTADAHIAAEKFIQEFSLALEVPEEIKIEDCDNVDANENGEAFNVPFAPLDSSTLFSDAHISMEDLIQEATLALEEPEKSKIKACYNVDANENSESFNVPFAPLDNYTLVSDAHISTEDFIQEAALALEAAEKCKIDDCYNVDVNRNSEALHVPFAPLDSSNLISDVHITTEEFIQEATFALEVPEKIPVDEITNVAADEKNASLRLQSASMGSSTVVCAADIPLVLKREGVIEADGCVVHDEKTEASPSSSVQTKI